MGERSIRSNSTNAHGVGARVWCPTCRSVVPLLRLEHEVKRIETTQERRYTRAGVLKEIVERDVPVTEMVALLGCPTCRKAPPDLGANTHEEYLRRIAGRWIYRALVFPVVTAVFVGSAFVSRHTIGSDGGDVALGVLLSTGAALVARVLLRAGFARRKISLSPVSLGRALVNVAGMIVISFLLFILMAAWFGMFEP